MQTSVPTPPVSRFGAVRWAVLAGIPDGEIQEVLSVARRRRFQRGETVFHQGDRGDSLHLVSTGHVAVRVVTPLGDVATLRILGAGAHFGDIALLNGGRRTASIVALDRVETLELAGADIARLRESHPSIERAILTFLAATVASLSNVVVETMYLPAPRRLARRLVELHDLYAGGAIPLTQDDLAGITGTSRQTINTTLTEMRDAGVVELGRGRVHVIDRIALDELAR